MAPLPPHDPLDLEPAGPRLRVMWISAWCFTALFAVWLMFGILGLGKKETVRYTSAADRYEEIDAEERLYRRIR